MSRTTPALHGESESEPGTLPIVQAPDGAEANEVASSPRAGGGQ